MSWKLDKDRPICPQISEQICTLIATGKFSPNERIPSVREIAVNAGVNPNTVQKALESLEEKAVIVSVRGSGWFVAEDVNAAKKMLSDCMEIKTKKYIEEMKSLGLNEKEIYEYMGGLIK